MHGSGGQGKNLQHGWQPSFADLGRPLIDTTFVVVDLETTGGSPTSASITEIGAVKIRGGEKIGEFQTLVNPGSPIPPFITVLTGITDAMVITAPPIGEALFSFLEFVGSPEETVLIAHNAPFDIGFLRAASEALSIRWPNFPVVDTARIARYVLTRDEVLNFKLGTLAAFFGAQTDPDHRALSDARATVDVFHGIVERLGSFGVTTLDDLRNFSNRITDAQRTKRGLATNLPQTAGVYIFRDKKGDVLYVGKTGNLRSRVRSYFSSSETRKRILEMIALAERVDVIETPTLIEAEIRELRLITDLKPRFNRRSKFQEKAIWVKLTEERYPRFTSVRGHTTLSDDVGWIGPFNGREQSGLAIEALHESLAIRQCTPRITERTMKFATPCALFDMKRCGAPCIGHESIDSYSTHVMKARLVMMQDGRLIDQALSQRMNELALQERFEEARDARERLMAFVRGAARGQRIRTLTRIPQLILRREESSHFEYIVLRYGRLVASTRIERTAFDHTLENKLVSELEKVAEVVVPADCILPASTHEEVEILYRFINESVLISLEGEWSSPAFGAESLRYRYENVTKTVEENQYKEDYLPERFRSRTRG